MIGYKTSLQLIEDDFGFSMEIYEKLESDMFGHIVRHLGFFWRDQIHPHGIGPFPSLQEAMNDYVFLAKSFKGDKDKNIAPVLKVDFLTKRRIP